MKTWSSKKSPISKWCFYGTEKKSNKKVSLRKPRQKIDNKTKPHQKRQKVYYKGKGYSVIFFNFNFALPRTEMCKNRFSDYM